MADKFQLQNTISVRQPTYILVRGLLGAYMPGHFKKVQSELQRGGAEVRFAPTDPAGTISQNAESIAHNLPKVIGQSNSVVFLAHSKGGLETLGAILNNPSLGKRTKAAILFQTPKRGAPYLKSLFRENIPKQPFQSVREYMHKLALTAILAKPACTELAGDEELPFVNEIERTRFSFPIFSYSTFSTSNSGWIELQANRINQLEPGRRNDGVFLTEDQVWPQFFHRELPEIDHAEPTVGSARIDEAALWRRVLVENELFPI